MTRSALRVDLNPFSSHVRPALSGSTGAVAAAHPLAVSAGQQILLQGGTAADAVIAAQAVIAVVMPEAAGLGGDGFFLVREANETVTALNGAGRTAQTEGGATSQLNCNTTVPGVVAAWDNLSHRWGRLPLAQTLQPAIRAARQGIRIDSGLSQAVNAQRTRLLAGGAERWPLLKLKTGDHFEQPELAATLDQIAKVGSGHFYHGSLPASMCAALTRCGSFLNEQAFAQHSTTIAKPLHVEWNGMKVHVPPPMSQGVLLLMALRSLEQLGRLDDISRQHALIELVGSVFVHRDRVSEADELMAMEHTIDSEKASNLRGARAYLHTAGVCCADGQGMIVSSLMSVFDDFGSAIFIPKGGFVLNNRGCGFTDAPNDFAPGKAPVHTLAPIMVTAPRICVGMATPGADGQVQTLLQVLSSWGAEQLDLATAMDRPRWRSEDGTLLMEPGHAALRALEAKGHALRPMPSGDMRAGSVMAAGLKADVPFAIADWRRHGWAGIV